MMKNFIVGSIVSSTFCFPLLGVAESIEDWDSTERLNSCYNSAETSDQKRACIFSTVEACQEKTEGGYSTIGMMQCNQSETNAWDVLLNQEYQATMRDFKLMDADDKSYNPDISKEATRTFTLQQAQRAWITFRDAECASEYALWGMGSMRMISGSACLLNMIAERTIALHEKRDLMR